MKAKVFQLLLALLLLPSSVVLADEEYDDTPQQALVLRFTDQTTASFFLADEPEVGFADGKLTVNATGVATDYEQSAVAEFYFDYVTPPPPTPPTSLSSVDGKSFSFVYTDNNTVTVSGSKAASATLYTADGQLVASKNVVNGTVTMSLEGCKPGVYVLTLQNEHTFKLIKK